MPLEIVQTFCYVSWCLLCVVRTRYDSTTFAHVRLPTRGSGGSGFYSSVPALVLFFLNIMTTHSFSWRLALSDEDLKAAYNMRHEVFVKEHGFDAGRELDR